jgi:hypothetical protein
MIPVGSLLYKIDQKLNKLSSNAHQEIPLEDKILAINEGQLILIKQKVDGKNSYKVGMDGFRKRYEDLEKLVEMYDEHPLSLTLVDKKLNRWAADITNITPAYMLYVDCYLTADKDECKDRIIYVNNDLAKHADIPTLLNNNNYKPSFEYQETFSIIASDEVSIFTDGSFTPKKLYLSYVRYPKYVDAEGYIKLDGSASINQDCELKNYLEDELLDIVVGNLSMYTENTAATQAAQIRKENNE